MEPMPPLFNGSYADLSPIELAAEEARLNKIIVEDDKFFDKILPLTKCDFAMIGQFIQYYCIADFNARRLIETARYVRTGIEDDIADKLNDADVILHLYKSKETFAAVPKLNIQEGLDRAARILEMHRTHRHNFAHWIIKRMPDENALILMSKNATDAKKRTGVAHPRGALTWGVLQLDGFHEEIEKLHGHGEFLAHASAHVDVFKEDIRAAYVKNKNGV